MVPLRDRLPTSRPPIVNYTIIALNLLVFVWELTAVGATGGAQQLVDDWALTPARFLEDPVGQAGTIFSSMFMHDPTRWWHVGLNMLSLWIFGDNVEDALGRAPYAAFYLLSGIAAAAGQMLVNPHSQIPMVGASGAIAGVMAAYVSLYPRSPITVLNPVPLLWIFFGLFLELPAWVVILEFFVINVWFGLRSLGSNQGGVAFFAHLGGFVAGLLLVRVFLSRISARDHERWHTFRSPGFRGSGGGRGGEDDRRHRRGPWAFWRS
jgi:membrane associated rhomboid family serine protease